MKPKRCDDCQDYHLFCKKKIMNILRDPAFGIIVQILIMNALILVAYQFGQYNAIAIHDWTKTCGRPDMNLTQYLHEIQCAVKETNETGYINGHYYTGTATDSDCSVYYDVQIDNGTTMRMSQGAAKHLS